MADDYLDRMCRSTTTFLGRWRGGSVRIRDVVLSFPVLQIVVFHTSDEMHRCNLCINVLDPLLVTGPSEWVPCAIAIDSIPVAGSPVEGRTTYDSVLRLRDAQAGFELLADSIEVHENLRLR